MEEPTTPGGGGEQQSTTGNYRESDIGFLRAQAKEWLEAVLGERWDGSSSLEDLLCDGTLLFRLSQIIRGDPSFPGHVESSSISSPSMDKRNSLKYQPYASMEAFLKVCKEVGLRDLDVFNPSDAVEKKDIRRLCVCLRRFSKKGRSRGIRVPDFDDVKETLVTPGAEMPKDAVRRTQESLQHSSSKSSRPSSMVSNETSSSIAELRKDGGESESDSKVHYDHDADAEHMVADAKHAEKVVEDVTTKEAKLILSRVESAHAPAQNAHDGTHAPASRPDFEAQKAHDGAHAPASKGLDYVDSKYVDSKYVDSHEEAATVAAPVEKKQVEPFRGLVIDKPKRNQSGEISDGEEKPPPKGLFIAHLRGTEPYVTKQGKEIKNDSGKDGGFWWLPFLGGAVAIAGGVAGLLFAKKRLDPEDGDDREEGENSVDFESGSNVYKVRKGDNLTQIARRSGKKNWREIVERNPSIKSPNLIHPGDSLEL